MKKLIIVLFAILLVLPTLTVKSQKKPPANIVEKMIVIQGDEGWLNTGIKVGSKDKVTIKAEGTVYFSDGTTLSDVNPGGMPQDVYARDWEFDAQYCNDPMPQTNHAALIGNLGNEDFLIGKKTAFSDKQGVLYLGINDCTLKDKFYNTGKFEVYIKVEHPK